MQTAYYPKILKEQIHSAVFAIIDENGFGITESVFVVSR